ncbi:hypothetical protein CDAR_395231 [Caerostris darwini]|uniref:Uncharacterized protein n=1 Tax=Caerostris darwini TaxID=1538125 RepID=A0AAV4QC11_9ARAC|nr:hypothetical protein CDAR_395231 [Caerostris darwini]
MVTEKECSVKFLKGAKQTTKMEAILFEIPSRRHFGVHDRKIVGRQYYVLTIYKNKSNPMPTQLVTIAEFQQQGMALPEGNGARSIE